MNFQEWEQAIPSQIRDDPLWNFVPYPKAVFLYELVWLDCEKLLKDVRGRAVARQLIDSAGSISANLEEGYGRGFGRDYAHFQRIAIGSARETRGWYLRARRLLSDEALNHRLNLLSEIIALLTRSSQTQYRRGRTPR